MFLRLLAVITPFFSASKISKRFFISGSICSGLILLTIISRANFLKPVYPENY